MNEPIGVKEFIDALNETLGFAFPEVVVQGEVSSFKINQGKWVFFDLKDEDATLGCFMSVYQLKVPLEDGMQVRVVGTPKLTKWGKFSFTARRVELAGEGELKRAFELLKKKLGAEGLFAPERKRSIPQFPQTIGLVASEQSAAYADFIKILGQRWGGLHITLADVQVQGAAAPEQIVAAIDQFNQQATPVDVLVIIRGGGSLEDLQAFNTEDVARAVAASRIPTVVGVGHEIDTSLADMAADVRAATPTDAARLVVPDRNAVLQQVSHQTVRIEQAVRDQVVRREQRVVMAVHGLERFVRQPIERLARAATSLRRDLQRIEMAAGAKRQAVAGAERTLGIELVKTVQNEHHRLDSLMRTLRSLDPKAVLSRGYSLVRQNGTVIKSAGQLTGHEFTIQFASDSAQAKLIDSKKRG